MKSGYFVYRFLDQFGNVIYVGKTKNMTNRMSGHKYSALTEGGHKGDMYLLVDLVEFCELPSEYHMNIYEMHYIAKYKPKYNIEYSTSNNDLFDLPELSWRVYVFTVFVKQMVLYDDDVKVIPKKQVQKDVNEKGELYVYVLTDFIFSRFTQMYFQEFMDTSPDSLDWADIDFNALYNGGV